MTICIVPVLLKKGDLREMAPGKDRRAQKKIGKQYGKQTNTIWTTGSKVGIETIEMTWQIYLTSKKIHV